MAEQNRKWFILPGDLVDSEVWEPDADVLRLQNGWMIKLALPGVRPEDVRIHSSGSQLTVSGVRRDTILEEGCTYHLLEISYSRFKRSITLPTDLENALIEADYQYGMLLVRVVEVKK